MDEAEPDIEEIKSRTMGLVQEESKPGEAGRSRNPRDQSLSPSPPILGSQGAHMQPKHYYVCPDFGDMVCLYCSSLFTLLCILIDLFVSFFNIHI
jgi:hypothetical protein